MLFFSLVSFSSLHSSLFCFLFIWCFCFFFLFLFYLISSFLVIILLLFCLSFNFYSSAFSGSTHCPYPPFSLFLFLLYLLFLLNDSRPWYILLAGKLVMKYQRCYHVRHPDVYCQRSPVTPNMCADPTGVSRHGPRAALGLQRSGGGRLYGSFSALTCSM